MIKLFSLVLLTIVTAPGFCQTSIKSVINKELEQKLMQIREGISPDMKNLLIKDPKSPGKFIPKIKIGGSAIYSDYNNKIEYKFRVPAFTGSGDEYKEFFIDLRDMIDKIFGDKYFMKNNDEKEGEKVWSTGFYEKAVQYTYQSPTHIFLVVGFDDNPEVLLVFYGKASDDE